jgi:hypothetical protein
MRGLPSRARPIAAAVAVTSLALAASAPASWAQAAPCKAPSDTSAIDEYCETLPAAGGDSPSGPGARKGGAALGRTLPRRTATELKRSAAGRALLRSPAPRRSERPSAERGGGGAPAPTAPSENPLGAVRQAVGSGTSAGPLFAWALLAVAVGLAGLAWLRRRRGSA